MPGVAPFIPLIAAAFTAVDSNVQQKAAMKNNANQNAASVANAQQASNNAKNAQQAWTSANPAPTGGAIAQPAAGVGAAPAAMSRSGAPAPTSLMTQAIMQGRNGLGSVPQTPTNLTAADVARILQGVQQ
jgi:hypothetical protein